MRDLKALVNSLSHQPGIYQMLDAQGTVIYVGKARDLKKRIASYFSGEKDAKTIALLRQISDINVTVTADENAALLLECNLIRQLRPHYNVIFRDDKSYPLILLTAHVFPQILLYRGQKRRGKGQFFGPFPDAGAVRDAINLVERIFRIRNCSDSFFASRKRPCLQYQIDRCTAPCTRPVAPADYQENVRNAVLFLQGKNQQVIHQLEEKMEQFASALAFEKAAACRDQIARLREIQAGQHVTGSGVRADIAGVAERAGQACIQLLVIRHGKMSGSWAFFPGMPQDACVADLLSAFVAQHYLDDRYAPADIPALIVLEGKLPDADWLSSALSVRAGHRVTFSRGTRGERKKWLEMARTSAEQSLATRLVARASLERRMKALTGVLDLPATPLRIECIDISHSMGEETVGSCVVFGAEGPLKHLYRRFCIKNITPGNDTAAIAQLVQRRYGHGAASGLPDILLVDGGLPQLHAASQALSALDRTGLLLVGVAKGAGRKPGLETLHLAGKPPLRLPSDSPALHLVQQIRDEAHRFAITGHRLRRDKKRTHSVLESVPGIGAKRRRELLRYFGGLQAINRASLDEIRKVPGISHELAQRLYNTLHELPGQITKVSDDTP